MKHLSYLLVLCALCVGPLRAADSYFGLKGATNAMESDTNYFLIVLGDGTNAVIRKVNPRQAKNILAGIGAVTNNFGGQFMVQLGINAGQIDISGSSLDDSTILSPALELYQLKARSGTWLIPTNSALSNIVINYATTNTLVLYITNNITLTNRTGLVADKSGRKRIIIVPQLITRGINHGLGIGYASRVLTNANNVVSNTLPANSFAVIDDDFIGTNIIRTLTMWQ